MKDFFDTTDVMIESPTVVAIGKFDGEHKGHKKVFSVMHEIAERKGLKTAVFTFQTPPAALVTGSVRPQIMTNGERRERLRNEGIDFIVEYPFTQEIMSLSGEDFVREVLIGKMNMRAIVAGPDCAFGHKRSGNAALLRRLGPIYGFETCIIEKEKTRGVDISSTLIRGLLEEGDVAEANRLLGAPYMIEGIVERGNQLGGRVLGFPTINVYPPCGKLLPKSGVYATEVEILDGSTAGTVYRGLTNVGVNPSVKEDSLSHRVRIESYLLDFTGDLYGRQVRILFYGFVRPEKTFSSMEDLKVQIAADLRTVRSGTFR